MFHHQVALWQDYQSLTKSPSNPCNLPALSAVGGAADQGGERDGDREGGGGVQDETGPSAKQNPSMRDALRGWGLIHWQISAKYCRMMPWTERYSGTIQKMHSILQISPPSSLSRKLDQTTTASIKFSQSVRLKRWPRSNKDARWKGGNA